MFDFLRQENGDGRCEGDDSDMLQGCRSGHRVRVARGLFGGAAATHDVGTQELNVLLDRFRLSVAAPRLGKVFIFQIITCNPNVACDLRVVRFGTFVRLVWGPIGWIFAKILAVLVKSRFAIGAAFKCRAELLDPIFSTTRRR